MCHPPAVVLHGRLIALAHSARSFALALVDTQFQSVPLLPRPKKKIQTGEIKDLVLAACPMSRKVLYNLRRHDSLFIHVCTSVIGYLQLDIWYWEMSIFYWMMVSCHNVSHPAGNMPSTVCLVLD